MQTHGPSIRQAIVSGLLDEAWAALEGAMRAWLSRRRGDQEVPDRKYARAEWRAEAPRARGRDGEAQSKAVDAALLRCECDGSVPSGTRSVAERWWR